MFNQEHRRRELVALSALLSRRLEELSEEAVKGSRPLDAIWAETDMVRDEWSKVNAELDALQSPAQ